MSTERTPEQQLEFERFVNNRKKGKLIEWSMINVFMWALSVITFICAEIFVIGLMRIERTLINCLMCSFVCLAQCIPVFLIFIGIYSDIFFKRNPELEHRTWKQRFDAIFSDRLATVYYMTHIVFMAITAIGAIIFLVLAELHVM